MISNVDQISGRGLAVPAKDIRATFSGTRNGLPTAPFLPAHLGQRNVILCHTEAECKLQYRSDNFVSLHPYSTL